MNVDAADALAIEPGEDVKVLLARGTKRQRLETFRVAGLFERFPGFPRGTDLVVNLRAYAARRGRSEVDSSSSEPSTAATRASRAPRLRFAPGRAREDPIDVETRATALDKDQSSLTALNVHGLVELDALYTLLISAVVIAIFVFGLMLERRREYVALRAQGMRVGELRTLVLGEAAVVAGLGMVAGLLVGTGMAVLLVWVLRPLFILDPRLALPAGDIARLVVLAGAATVASALAATALLRRLKPAELLREV